MDSTGTPTPSRSRAPTPRTVAATLPPGEGHQPLLGVMPVISMFSTPSTSAHPPSGSSTAPQSFHTLTSSLNQPRDAAVPSSTMPRPTTQPPPDLDMIPAPFRGGNTPTNSRPAADDYIDEVKDLLLEAVWYFYSYIYTINMWPSQTVQRELVCRAWKAACDTRTQTIRWILSDRMIRLVRSAHSRSLSCGYNTHLTLIVFPDRCTQVECPWGCVRQDLLTHC